MLCRTLCIGRRSRKEYQRRCEAGRANNCYECRYRKEESSRLPFYDGVPAPTEVVRGIKNRRAAGGCSGANFLRRTRGDASSICFKSEAAISKERWTR